ncbi:hypothetical protein IHC92_20565 [Photobacterium damselae subsp. damselae]|uniref:hypothetical protein n=1 Tax=Photobacterium damselae TaxID=38293 RepID=UPI001F1966E6|nr:hypothetical protein [Photobacterium damselae]UKA23347.1 hypothetical protein IHC92_20565 [Photobacterium damselae subsp. damselae]
MSYQFPHNPDQQSPMSSGGATSNTHNQWIMTSINELNGKLAVINELNIKLEVIKEKHNGLDEELKQLSSVAINVKFIMAIGAILLGVLSWGGNELYNLNKEHGVNTTKLEAMSEELEKSDKFEEEIMKKLDKLVMQAEKNSKP